MKIRTLSFIASLVAAISSSAQTSLPANATNTLGLDLYRIEAAAKSGNILLSPYSIQSALTMALGGADGKTKEEMVRVLHLGANAGKAPEEFAVLRQQLEKAAADSQKQAQEAKKHGGNFDPLQLRVANRLFGRDSYPFDAEFLKRTQDLWQAPLEKTAFGKDPEAARRHINEWVEKQTEKRIVDLISRGGVNESTRLVLVNALYFKAAWADEFSRHNTKPLPFFAGGKSSVNVPTLSQVSHYGYTKGPDYSAVTLAYTGGETQLLVILPDAKDGLAALEKNLKTGDLAKLSKLPSDREVELFLPKFKIEPPTISLGDHLKSLGMKTAFDDPPGSADFSRMAPRTPQEYLFISAVYHKTFMALDEKGTEAAAATAVVMALPGPVGQEKPKPIEVRVDHPFLFAIQHRTSGVCLFIGRVNDPR